MQNITMKTKIVLPLIISIFCVFIERDGFAASDSLEKETSDKSFFKLYKSELIKAINGDAEAQFGMANVHYPYIGLLPPEEALRTTLNIQAAWLRKAAYGGNKRAIDALAHDYLIGTPVVPKDYDLYLCFHNVNYDQQKIKECQQLELSKDYITDLSDIYKCFACESKSDLERQ